jgi:hypothetical protein
MNRFSFAKLDANSRRHGRVWQVLSTLCLAGAGASLTAALAFALGASGGFGTGSASTGSVTLGLNAPATTVCTYSNLSPGDLTGAQSCALSVTYTGSLSAYGSLTVALQSKAGSGGTKLYDGTNTSGLTLSISDGHKTFTVPTGAGTTGGSCPAGFTCWTSSNELAGWYTGATPNLIFTNTSSAVTWTVTPLFPKGVLNPYQGGTATLTLTAQAVQSAGNTLPAACTTSTIGTPCSGAGFGWS